MHTHHIQYGYACTHIYNILYIIQAAYIIMYIIYKVNSNRVSSRKYWILDVLQRFTFQGLVAAPVVLLGASDTWKR